MISSAPFRVGGETDAKRLAGALAKDARAAELAAPGVPHVVRMEMIGAAAVNVAVKAVAIARSYLAVNGLDLSLRPSFFDIEVAGKEKSAIAFAVVIRPRD